MVDLGPYSGALATQNHGMRRVRVVSITENVSIIANEAEAGSRHVFYPVRTAGGFSITVGFPSYESRDRFNRWMEGFMNKTLSGRGFNGAMLVAVPDRDFIRQAVATGPLLLGEGVTDLAYSTQISFQKTSDAVDAPLKDKEVSTFQMPKRKGVSRYFYPAGQQLSGSEGLEGALFGGVVDGWAVGGGLETEPDLDPSGFSGEIGDY